jgi:hypothetical protein
MSPTSSASRPAALAREPLVHFLLIGAALFGLNALVGGGTSEGDVEDIVITRGTVDHLAAMFLAAWQRPPTGEELGGLIQDHILEEVLVREGIAMGLDQDDTIIRRRIRQKMEFIAADMAGLVPPTEDDLRAYLAEHAERFKTPPRLTLRQILFDPARRGAAVEDDARRHLERLRARPDAADLIAAGDTSLLEPVLAGVTERDLEGMLGERFAGRVAELSPGEWSGPIESAYGLHLVRLESREEGRVPELDEIRAEVEREWEHARRVEVETRFYGSLRDRYRVIIEEDVNPILPSNAAEAGQ